MKKFKPGNIDSEFDFTKPAVYKIIVQGELEESWSARLGGMQINIERLKGKKSKTILVGQINDQSALSGILNTLYESLIPIISVNMLSK